MIEEIGSVYLSNTDGYRDFLAGIEKQFYKMVTKNTPVFTTNAVNLFDIFISDLPQESKRYYNCGICKKFVNTYGNLVTVSELGKMNSIFWNEKYTPDFFKKTVSMLQKTVLESELTGVFISSKDIWGSPETGEWHHISVRPLSCNIFSSQLQTDKQVMLEKKENFLTLQADLEEYNASAVREALTLLKSEVLYCYDMCIDMAEWLDDVHTKISKGKDKKSKDNILWRAVATAPSSFCYIRSTMLGALLDDIIAELPHEIINKRFTERICLAQSQASLKESSIKLEL